MAVDVARDGHVATLTLNRPDVLNAFNTEQLEALRDALAGVTRDPEVRAIIITGAGDRAFAAGADIAEMRDKGPSQALIFARLGQSVCSMLENAPQPTIAAINGFALGGGCELALACDIRICSENAQLGQPEVTLGIPPGWGGTQRLARVIGRAAAKELILTGRRIGAEEALRLGLVSAVYPAEELMPRARELAERIAANAPVAVYYAKEAINRGVETDLETALAYEAHLFALAFDTRDQKEGMGAFLERRKPDFTGQ
ncbi:enoyl-CoA hydratase-related protein [Sphaerobacter sp.]|uniref:enoyl-CoA hydratase-related protein n=1 Tax=Sphaerobacter sp. TaxID=2099654 RepID=UPI001DFB461D|nr:enoyl-CoA hydratase-related protein [Sphaerobacter sp.]MBX5443960.1 enoyl-CoA hydratase/isomerase family protein [Sphaerobacter sp.]